MTTPETELVEVARLKPHPRNYKQHPPEQLQHIVKSIEEHGFYRNVVVARDYTILAGHGVVLAVQSMGLFGPQRVPIIRLDVDAEEPRALKILTGDNELGKFAETDDRALTELLRDVMTIDDLLGTGFDQQRLAALTYVTRHENEIKSVDEAAEWLGMPEFEATEAQPKIIVNFETDDDRAAFMLALEAEFGPVVARKTAKTWSFWWPARVRRDVSSLRFDFDGATR